MKNHISFSIKIDIIKFLISAHIYISVYHYVSDEQGSITHVLSEDATRYILNNEKAFFNEFSERASAAGLSDTQIAEVFEAMRKGDYAKMAIYFDTSSPVDGAVFWSGNKEGAAQKPIWDAMSSQYANGAEGIATYAHPDGYEGKVRSNIEKPILEENDIIIQEGIIGAK